MATKKLYRSKHGEVFGVCQGIADWRDLPVGPVRLIVLLAIVFTGIFPGRRDLSAGAWSSLAKPLYRTYPSVTRRPLPPLGTSKGLHRFGLGWPFAGWGILAFMILTVMATNENDEDDAVRSPMC
jgi:phage shock protein PspC (stress-responsive transcriptional regulator)